MFDMVIGRMKEFFLDRAAITAAMDRATYKAHMSFGAYTMTVARNSIRTIGKKGMASKPGNPPKSRTGLLKGNIFFDPYNPQTRSVVIGAALLPKTSWAQAILEHGGPARQKNPRRRFRKVGHGGEIRLYEGKACRTTKTVTGSHGEQRVTYAKLTTQAQADRANRLNELIYGPAEIAAVIAPRPYMDPAFEKGKRKLPQFWENAISKS